MIMTVRDNADSPAYKVSCCDSCARQIRKATVSDERNATAEYPARQLCKDCDTLKPPAPPVQASTPERDGDVEDADPAITSGPEL